MPSNKSPYNIKSRHFYSIVIPKQEILILPLLRIYFIDREKIISVSKNLKILPYSPQDFTVDNTFVKEIMETGVKIV
ncbi:MAG: hypothetical protein JRJ49_09580 [Deltaproteobacteria bacterium]|nr:hypothetical protein [Deltaproteobacteria bacterium]